MKRILLLLVTCHLSLVTCFAAVAFDAATGYNASSATTTHNFNHTVGSGLTRALYVVVHTQNNPAATVSSVSFNSVAASLVVGCTNSELRTEIWRLVNPSSGTLQVSITVSVSDEVNAEAISFTGVDQTTPEEDTDSLCTDVTSSTLTLTSGSTSGCLDGIGVNAAMTVLAEGANQTGRNLVENDNNMDSDASTEIATTNCTMSWTWTGGFADRTHVAVAIRASTAPTAFPMTYYEQMRKQ